MSAPVAPYGDTWLNDLIDYGFRELDRDKSWPTYDGKELDRLDFMSASEATVCIRRLAYEKSQTPPTDEVESDWIGVQQRGHASEARLVDALYAAQGNADDWFLTGMGPAQVSVYDDGLMLSATPDGYLCLPKRLIAVPLEYKSVHPNTNLESMSAPKYAHVVQMIQNHLIVSGLPEEVDFPQFRDGGRPAGEGAYKIADYGLIVYTCANDLMRRRVFKVNLNGPAEDQIKTGLIEKARLLFDNDMTSKDYDASQGIKQNDCRFCRFRTLCSEAGGYSGTVGVQPPAGVFAKLSKGAGGSVSPQGATERRLLSSYAASRHLLEEYKKDYGALEEQVRALVATKPGLEMQSGPHRAWLTEIAGRKTLNAQLVADAMGVATPADLPDGFYKTGKPSIRLNFETKE